VPAVQHARLGLRQSPAQRRSTTDTDAEPRGAHDRRRDAARNGYTIQIVHDEDCSSPRENENVGLFLGFPHRHYNIGDEKFDPSEYTRPCTGEKCEQGMAPSTA
jgi:hypothetical protein